LSSTVRLLIVTVGGVHVALPADRVQGLLRIEAAGSGDAVILRGVTYAGVDLAGRLGLPADDRGRDTRVVLLEDGQRRGAIYAAHVHGLQELEQTQVLPLPGQFYGEERTWYQGLVFFQESVALILNPAWVLDGCPAGQTVETERSHSGTRQWLPSGAVSAEG
jgi:chemotaxis protein histidine kinase CheA